MLKQIGGLFIVFLVFLITMPLCFSHPHPMVNIEVKPNDIVIQALHWQVVNLPYLHRNLIFENCNYSIFIQDPFKYYDMETHIYIYHTCSNLTISKNTLFKDYWGDIPILTTTQGFGDSFVEEDIIDNNVKNVTSVKSVINFGNITLPKNPLILIIVILLLGGFFAFVGDFFNLVVPISLSSKHEKNKFLWLKAGIIHLVSTYIVFLFSINFIVNKIHRFAGFFVIFVGLMILLEKYMKKINISPLVIAVIPCSAALFVAAVLLKEGMFFAYFAPLLMGIGETAVLKLGSLVPYPRRFAKFIPVLIIISGIIFTIKVFVLS